MTLHDRRRRICAKVTARIAEVAPRGLGRWEHAWELVGEPADRFLDALSAYLAADTAETRRAIHDATDALVRAWRAAGEAWDQAGRPGAPESVEVTA